MSLIKSLCLAHEIDFDWLSEEILRKYHAAKVDRIEMSDSDTEAIINEAIQHLR